MPLISGNQKNSENKKSDYIVVNNCGYYKDLEYTYYTARPNGRSDYQLIYIKKGCGKFKIDGTTTILSQGDLVIYHPFEPQFYTYYSDNVEHESYWIHFAGKSVEKLLRSANLWDKTIYKIGNNSEICELILKMVKEFQLENKNYDVFNTGYFLQVIAILSRLTEQSENTVYKNLRRLEVVLDDMHNNFQNNKNVDDYAKMCYLSTSRFTHMFKECFGMSPIAYRKQIRVKQAKQLLKNTSLSVREISEIVGFGDSLYFSRIFKNSTGYSPNEYRNLK